MLSILLWIILSLIVHAVFYDTAKCNVSMTLTKSGTNLVTTQSMDFHEPSQLTASNSSLISKKSME